MRLERPTARRRAEFLAAVRRSQRLHVPWVSPPASAAAYAAYLRRLRRRRHVGHLVCRRDTGEIVGVVNISEIVGGVFRSGYLGYYAFVPHAGHGLMREGLSLVITEAFRRRRLHRLEANIQPANRRSIRLVGAWASVVKASPGATSGSSGDGATTSAGRSSRRRGARAARASSPA